MGAQPHAVVDSCLCIAIWDGGLVAALARLKVSLILPDVLADDELKAPDLSAFVAAGVAIEEATPQEVALVATLSSVAGAISVRDRFALAMSEQRHYLLLTGDRRLRVLAESRAVKCHGVLWVLDELAPMVGPAVVASALKAMVDQGTWLPADQVARRLHLWRKRT